MNASTRSFTLFLLTIMAAVPRLNSAEPGSGPIYWPQFRGPNASGVAVGAKPPQKVGPNSPLLWKIKVSWSPSSPCIWGNNIFLTTYDKGRLETHCYDRGNGALLWNKGVRAKLLEQFHRTDGSPAASTPATDGRHVVSYFGSFGLICFDFKGEELWRHPMPVAVSAGQFGTGTSPIIAGNAVILSRDERTNSKLIALDVATGKPLWESPRPEAVGSFGSPIIWKNQGVEELIVPGSVHLKAFSLESGKPRWMITGLTTFSCTTPVLGQGRLYYGAWAPGGADKPWSEWSEFRATHDKNSDGKVGLDEFSDQARDFFRALDTDRDGSVSEDDWSILKQRAKLGKNKLIAVEAGGEGDITASHVSWSYTKGLPYVSSPLYYKGRIYIVRDGGILSSLDAKTGRPFYSRERLRAGGSYYTSPVAADDRIFLASLPGKLTVIKADGDKPEILHEADFGERIFATPALVEDKLYLRTETWLYAFGTGSG